MFIKFNIRYCHYRKTSILGHYPITEVAMPLLFHFLINADHLLNEAGFAKVCVVYNQVLVVVFINAVLSYPNPYTR